MKVTLKNVTKKFKNISKDLDDVIAVNNFDFEIEDGKLVGLLGPSGCGKSTCLNLICGLLDPTEGKIYFGDTDVSLIPPEKRGVGMVFQNYALYPHLTVKKNIMFPLENLRGENKLSKKEMEDKVLETAKLVQIDTLLDRKPAQLSGGQQQRVAIARALVKKPNVLLLDEPLSNLDARLRLQTREQIRRIQTETGITTIFVTHDQEEAMSICDQIILMKEGTVQQIGKPQDVYNKPVNLFVAKFLGTPQINVFDGEVKERKLYIDNKYVLDTVLQDQRVTVGVRPEGFVIDENGLFECDFIRSEVMGRDVSIVAENKANLNDSPIRMIIDSTQEIKNTKKIKVNLKQNKTYIFAKDDERAL